MRIGIARYRSAGAINTRPEARRRSARVAEELMASREIPIADHLILSGNLSHYISQLPEKFQSSREVERILGESDLAPQVHRMSLKIGRDLNSGYDDRRLSRRRAT